MKFSIEVGEVEKHRIEFNHNQLLGSLTIKVDAKPVHRMIRFINEPVREVYRVVVGEVERSEVRIEKVRKQMLGYRNRIYVGSRLVQVVEGY